MAVRRRSDRNKTATKALSAGPAIAALAMMSTAAAAVGAVCFDEIEQNYQWDDGGSTYSSLPNLCPNAPRPAAPQERKWGGSVAIRASGQDAEVIEENYTWVPKWDAQGVCLGVFETVNRRTRIAKGGVLYETKQTDDRPPSLSQRVMRPNEVIYISNIQTVPKPNDPFVQILGNGTIAGQPCQRVGPKQDLGAGRWEMCVFVAPRTCHLAQYLQPLELNGPIYHGVTTLLRYGGRGEVLQPDSIKAP
jgi:hypothetical protein